MRRYIEVLRIRWVAQTMGAQLAARFPLGMTSLLVILHIQGATGLYALGGAISGLVALTQAVSGPLAGRLMSIMSMRLVLAVMVVGCGTGLALLALLPVTPLGSMFLAVFIGLTMPAISGSVRTLYPHLVPTRSLGALYSLDASAQELIWILGPTLAALVGTSIGTTVGLLIDAGVTVVGGAWYISLPPIATLRIPKPTSTFGAVLRKRPVLLATLIGALAIGSFGAVETSTVASFGHSGPEAGVVMAVWAASSLVGGLRLGHRAIKRWSMALRLSLAFLGIALAGVSTNFWWLCAVLLLSGFGVAPFIAALSANVSASVRVSESAEAFGWVNTGQLVGVAVGAYLAGFAIDRLGALSGFWVAAAICLAAVCLAAFTSGMQPDLRHGVPGPVPETGTIPMVRG